MLPPGQKARTDFPRFGLPRYATKFPSNISNLTLAIEINGENQSRFDLSATDLPRVSIQSDFHCVTTWTYVGATWGGIKFTDFYEKHIRYLDNEEAPITGAVFYAQDGYKTALLLNDLLRDNVLLADSLDGQPLSIEHGAPLRLVAPEHYGYKNLKHLERIAFYSKVPVIKRGVRAFLDHPRARVNQEERGRWVPGRILRYLYRPLISGTVREFRTAMEQYKP